MTARHTATSRPRIRRQATTFATIEFVRPDCFWPDPFSTEQAFGVLQAAIARAAETMTRQDLDRLMGHGDFHHDRAIRVDSPADLRKIFQKLVLGRLDGHLEAWRKDAGLDVTGAFTAAFPHYKPFGGTPLQGHSRASEYDVKRHLAWLLEGCRDMELAVSLNSVHLRARRVKGVAVLVNAKGFVFSLTYMLDGSTWSEPLATSSGDEPFSATLDRAIDRMNLLFGKGHTAASLCEALNRNENVSKRDPWQTHFWVRGERPVMATEYSGHPPTRFRTTTSLGHGASGCLLVETPSGRVVSCDRSHDWPRMKMLQTILNQRYAPPSECPTPDTVRAIKDNETVETRPTFDRLGRSLYDRNGNLLSEEALAGQRSQTADSDIDPEALFRFGDNALTQTAVIA